MTQLGISPQNIRSEQQEWPAPMEDAEPVYISYNQTDPNYIRDGMNGIEVAQVAAETYRVQ
jgi:hypothetical protein